MVNQSDFLYIPLICPKDDHDLTSNGVFSEWNFPQSRSPLGHRSAISTYSSDVVELAELDELGEGDDAL